MEFKKLESMKAKMQKIINKKNGIYEWKMQKSMNDIVESMNIKLKFMNVKVQESMNDKIESINVKIQVSKSIN